MGIFRRIDNGTTTVRDGQIVKYLIIVGFIMGLLLGSLIIKGF